MDFLSSIINWQFQNETLAHWFIFTGALMLILWTWRGIVEFVK